MATYTAAEAAAKLDIKPKLLRRLLREDRTLKAPGSGSSWSFTDEDIPKLEQIVADHQGKKSSKTAKTTPITDDAGLPAAICRSRARSDRARVRALNAERTARLEAALVRVGLHISQLPEAPGRRWATQHDDAEAIAS